MNRIETEIFCDKEIFSRLKKSLKAAFKVGFQFSFTLPERKLYFNFEKDPILMLSTEKGKIVASTMVLIIKINLNK